MTTNAPSQHALVIGSGVGGLSVAILLVRLGYRVTVIEKNALPGGLMRSYARKGIQCPVGVHYLGALGRGQVLRSLFDLLGVSHRIPVEPMGTEGVIDRYLFDDFTFDLPPGIEAYEENLRNTFPDEQEQVRTYTRMLLNASRQLETLEFLFSGLGPFRILDQMRPLGEILTELRCSPRLRSVLSVPSAWVGVPLDRAPAVYHNMSLASYLASSWRLSCSGAEMADAFAASLTQGGGEIITGDKAERILVEAGSVQGLGLSSGRVLHAPLVVAAIHPKVALKILPEGAVRPVYKNRLRKLTDTPSILSVHVAVDASVHREIPYNIFRIETDRNGNVEDACFLQIRKSQQTGKNLLSILTSANTDRWRPWESTRTGRRGEDYRKEKEKEAWRLLRAAEPVFGKLRDPELLDVATPLTLRDWVDSPGGSAYGVLRSTDQMRALALLNRCLVPGFHLAGQSVLAPGILGTILGSLNTVKSIAGPERFRESIRL